MVFIKNNVPSLKNSKVKTSRGVFPSKTVSKYLRSHGIASYSASKKIVEGYKTIPMTFPHEELRALLASDSYPIIIGFHFVRDSERSFDFNNVTQIIMDLMTAYDIIPDDSMRYVIPYCTTIDGRHYTVDKENPGVFISRING